MHTTSSAPPVVLRSLIDDDGILQVFDVACAARMRKAVAEVGIAKHSILYFQRGPGRGVRFMDDDVWRTFRQHVGVNTVLAKILERAREEANWSGLLCASAFDALSLRCCEFHEYKAGGGLTASGHIDAGSTLTLSVQLTHPTALSGRFSTTDARGIVSTTGSQRGPWSVPPPD